MKFLEQVGTERFVVNHLSLRSLLIYDFQSFIDVFFQKRGTRSHVKGLLSGITFKVGFFSFSLDEEAFLKQNAFKIMEDQLQEANR